MYFGKTTLGGICSWEGGGGWEHLLDPDIFVHTLVRVAEDEHYSPLPGRVYLYKPNQLESQSRRYGLAIHLW